MSSKSKVIYFNVIFSILIGFSGCTQQGITVFGKYTGYDFDGTIYKLNNVEFETSKFKGFKLDKNKAYVQRTGPRAMIEVIDGKVTLINYHPKGLSHFGEVSPGKHIYMAWNDCGLYRVTIDAKKGYIYPLKGKAFSAGIMSWCRSKVYNYYALDTSKTSYKEFQIAFFYNEKYKKEMDEIVEGSFWQSDYDRFLDDIEDGDIDKRRDAYIAADEGVKMEW